MSRAATRCSTRYERWPRRSPPGAMRSSRAAGYRQTSSRSCPLRGASVRWCPPATGGKGLTFAEQLLVIRELARADGSVGWTVMIGSSAPVVLGLLPRSSFDQIYAKGPDVILGGAFNPKGVATPVDGGYRVSGRWSFASGCQHCHWFVAHCMVDDGRMPPVRMMVLPPSDVEIADTWYVSGLCGTGSHDFVVDDVFVPDERSFTLWDEPALDGPLWRIPELSLSSLMMANVAVGIAEGALGEITTLASGKVPMLADSTLGANALFQHDLAEADARLRAARALLAADAATAWRIADAGRELSPEDRARTRSTARVGREDGGLRGRRRLPRRRRHLSLREQSAAAPPARRARRDPALRPQARHVDAGRVGARRPGRCRPVVPVIRKHRSPMATSTHLGSPAPNSGPPGMG